MSGSKLKTEYICTISPGWDHSTAAVWNHPSNLHITQLFMTQFTSESFLKLGVQGNFRKKIWKLVLVCWFGSSCRHQRMCEQPMHLTLQCELCRLYQLLPVCLSWRANRSQACSTGELHKLLLHLNEYDLCWLINNESTYIDSYKAFDSISHTNCCI